ncbi:hypothetical protein GGR57DRAFT_429861 [Xylariaceae sp. FL1272]|nr:hypothetical protein GGR57DRAFT_429861 [Xylariaceae sp. FL1272]
MQEPRLTGQLPIPYEEGPEFGTWDEENPIASERLRTARISGMEKKPQYRHGLARAALFCRMYDLRRLLILAVVAITLSLAVFKAHQHELIKITPGEISNTLESAPEPNHPPGQCTTWPVTAKGEYKTKFQKSTFELQSFAPQGGWKKPEGIAIKALIFYGRKRTVDFLECYLQQNLVSNGGFLDEVWFLVHTDNSEDLAYLETLVEEPRNKEYYKIVTPGKCRGFQYGCVWDPIVEDDTIYIKIDDEIFIHPDTIPQLVSTRIAEPQPFAISANLVNSPLTGYKHYDTGAIHPFLPDPSLNASSQKAAQSWRPSDKSTFPSAQLPNIEESDRIGTVSPQTVDDFLGSQVGYEGHPWLLLEDSVENALLKTPMGINKFRLPQDDANSIYGAAWRSWKIAAQQQYSLLRNLELNTMWRYHFGRQIDYERGVNSSADQAALKFVDPNHLGPGGEQLFDTNYIRYNLNFVALWGHDIRNALPIAEDDEQDITVTIPQRLQRPFAIDTRAVVGHLSFFPQHDGIRQTDLLDRWRALANEISCAADNQKTPFDLRCAGY